MLPYLKQNEEQINNYIAGVTTEMVKASLKKERRGFRICSTLFLRQPEKNLI